MDGFAHKQFGSMELSLYKHTCVSHVHVYIVCLVCHYDRYLKQLKEHKIHWDLIVQKLKSLWSVEFIVSGLGVWQNTITEEYAGAGMFASWQRGSRVGMQKRVRIKELELPGTRPCFRILHPRCLFSPHLKIEA